MAFGCVHPSSFTLSGGRERVVLYAGCRVERVIEWGVKSKGEGMQGK